MSKFSRLTPGMLADPPPAVADLPQIGTVTAASTSGALVVIDAMPGQAFGPAPWSLGSYASFAASITAGAYPHVGDRCLLVFAGVGVGSPVVAAWWR